MTNDVLIYGPCADEYSLSKVNRSLAAAIQHAVLQRDAAATAHKNTTDPATSSLKIHIGGRQNEVSRLPGVSDFVRYPELAELAIDLDKPEWKDKKWDIVIYNNFPKDPSGLHGLAKLPGKVKISLLAWEENRFPEKWVKEYNEHLDCVFAASLHTLMVLRRSGVKLPIYIIPNAPFPLAQSGDTGDAKAAQIELASRSKQLSAVAAAKSSGAKLLLHISSGLARKGAKELIAAFGREFYSQTKAKPGDRGGDRGVDRGVNEILKPLLVIKSYPNSTNEFPAAISALPKDVRERIIYLDNDFSDAEMMALMGMCDVYVSPSKAEGFNMPVLEAMDMGLVVVATGWSGQMDFLNDYNSYLVDYELKPARSHLDNPGAFWAEPDAADLGRKLRLALSNDNKAKILRAWHTSRRFNWGDSASKVIDLLPALRPLEKLGETHLAVISTYNTVCGIAEYSSYLYSELESSFASISYLATKDTTNRVNIDKDNVYRLWEHGEVDFAGVLDFCERRKGEGKLDLVHIQYNLGFYNFMALKKLIEGLEKLEIKIILTPHSVQHPGSELGQLKDTLQKCHQIHVLNQEDLSYLNKQGLTNCYYFPHGGVLFPYQSKSRLRSRFSFDNFAPVVATHGFLVENKGVFETLEAVAQLKMSYPNIKLIALNAVNPRNMNSAALAVRFKQEISRLGLENNVIHISDFLDREEIITILGLADVLVFPYPESKETASGSIRLALAAGRPVIVSQSSQLKDLHDICHSIADNSPALIASAIETLYQDEDLSHSVLLKIQKYAASHSWPELSSEYFALASKLI